MDKLNPRHEKFALAYFENGNASEAFRAAYPGALKWTDKTIWERASRLLANSKVQARLQEIRGKAEAEVLMTRAQACTLLANMANNSKAKDTDRRGAIETLAKLNGWYAPDKVEAQSMSLSELTIRIIEGNK